MGIAVPEDTESSSRSNLASVTYTAIALVFFFGVGLAGGAVYKIYFGDGAGPQIADRVSPPPALPVEPQASASQNFAANKPSKAEEAAPDLARIEPTAPPALAPPPAPTPAEATKPHAPSARVAQATPRPAPPQAPAEPAPAPQAAAAEPVPVPYAEVAPLRPDTQLETQAVKPAHVAAIPPKKPEKEAMVAKAHRSSPPQTAALHPPPAAPSGATGPFRVQFGAFANEDNARRVQWAIEATGLKVEVSQEPGPSGHPLYFLRSPSYPDYASALSAAQTVQHRVEHFVNAIPIEYAIRGDRAALEQQAQR
jgi:SPOR domain